MSPRRPSLRVAVRIFVPAALLALTFVVATIAAPRAVGGAFGAAQRSIAEGLGWFYGLVMSGALVACLALALSPLGAIRLGRDDERPEFGTAAWLAMLFSAGMGIGLLFYGVAEPLTHYESPPEGLGRTSDAAHLAMRLTFFHWGLHAWSVFTLVGVSLGYYCHRRGLPLSLRVLLVGVLGRRALGPVGDVVDVLAILGTLFGVATSLGLGSLQVAEGLGRLGLHLGEPFGETLIIWAITALATASVVSGVHAGIRRLSELNLVLGAALVLFVLLAGPTWFIARTGLADAASYLWFLPSESGRVFVGRGDRWVTSWTVTYWGWWLSWSPFVGMFIARVSRGRTVRELVVGAMLVPSAMAVGWLAVFGGAALHGPVALGDQSLVDVAAASAPAALFQLLEGLPLSDVTRWLAVAVIVTFFVTSSDSGSLVVDMLASGGDPDPPWPQRVFWSVMEGGVATALLLAGAGSLRALQAASISTGLPLALLVIAGAVGLVRSMWIDAGPAPSGAAPPDPR